MSTVTRREDPIRKYGWIVLVSLIGACVWLALPLTQGRWEGSGRLSKEAASDQSLDALDSALSSTSSDASVAKKEEPGAYPHPSDENAPAIEAAAGSIAAPGDPFDPAAGASNLAEALKNVAKSGGAPETKSAKKDSKGWGGESPRTGFARPQANFNALSGLSTGGSSGASTSAGSSGSGGARSSGSGRGPSVGLAASDSAAQSGGTPFLNRQGQAMNALQNAQANAASALGASKYDSAAGANSRTFDASPSRNTTLNADAGGGALIGGSLDNMPANLKADDPNLKKKDFQPPKIDPKEVQDPESQMMASLEQMLMQAAISGVAGTFFNSLGGQIASSLGMQVIQNSLNRNSDGSYSDSDGAIYDKRK